jgi:hypothetical protein
MANRAKNVPRKRWLETLLDAMTAPADAMREHLAEVNQNATLGAAAEVGVRNLLRAVVPARVGVTSGFLRELTADALTSAAIAGDEGAGGVAPGSAVAVEPSTTRPPPPRLSPQTDVLLYDASHAIPLYGMGGVDILSAHDVLGVIEVKDTSRGTEELATTPAERKGDQRTPLALRRAARNRRAAKTERKVGRGKLPPEPRKGALEHLDSVRKYAGRALRGVVLFRGTGGAVGSEAQAVQRLVSNEFGAQRVFEAPHFIYCASSTIGQGDQATSALQGGYLAFYDCRSEEMQVVEYANDRGAALASFLRIVTGFLAVQGLVSPAVHLELHSMNKEPSTRKAFALPGTKPKPTDLYRSLVERRRMMAEAQGTPTSPTFDQALTSLLTEKARAAVRAFVSTGRGPADLPTSGFCLEVETGQNGLQRAFFYLDAPGHFTCAGADNGDPWSVEGEGFDEYMRRILRENDLAEIYQKNTREMRRVPPLGGAAKPVAEGES